MNAVLLWIFEKTNGWKSVIGWVVAKLAALAITYFPDIPQAELIKILEYLGEAILAFGLAHKVKKEVEKKKEPVGDKAGA